jgi:hypothetical protein
MTTESKKFENFMESFTEELINTPDEEILEGCDPKALEENKKRVLDAAQAEAERRIKDSHRSNK